MKIAPARRISNLGKTFALEAQNLFGNFVSCSSAIDGAAKSNCRSAVDVFRITFSNFYVIHVDNDAFSNEFYS